MAFPSGCGQKARARRCKSSPGTQPGCGLRLARGLSGHNAARCRGIRRPDDAEFFALDERIAEVARKIPGYLGEEAWENAATGLISNVYYWDSMEACSS